MKHHGDREDNQSGESGVNSRTPDIPRGCPAIPRQHFVDVRKSAGNDGHDDHKRKHARRHSPEGKERPASRLIRLGRAVGPSGSQFLTRLLHERRRIRIQVLLQRVSLFNDKSSQAPFEDGCAQQRDGSEQVQEPHGKRKENVAKQIDSADQKIQRNEQPPDNHPLSSGADQRNVPPDIALGDLMIGQRIQSVAIP